MHGAMGTEMAVEAAYPRLTMTNLLQRQLLQKLIHEGRYALDWSLRIKKVLVVGCGDGETTAVVLLPYVPGDVTIIAVDTRRDMLEQARARFTDPRLVFMEMDIVGRDIEESPVWALGPFSKVFSFFYLQSIRDQNLALENISKLLCPGGETLLVLVVHTAVDALYQALARSSLWKQYVEDYRHYVTPYQLLDAPGDVLKEYLEDAGLHVKSSSRREAFLIAESLPLIKEGVKATNLSPELLPQELRELYLDECMNEITSNGKLTVPPSSALYYYKYTALVAHAVKLSIQPELSTQPIDLTLPKSLE